MCIQRTNAPLENCKKTATSSGKELESVTPDYHTETGEANASQPFDFSQPRVEVVPPLHTPNGLASGVNTHQIASRGLAQTFGLLPGMAALTVVTDVMLHGADVVSAGLLIPFSILGGGVLGYITYKSQLKHYGDDEESAKIKGLIVAFLTAIPSPLPYMLFIPAGLVGFFRRRS